MHMPGNGIGRTMGPLEWALLLALSVLWGGTFVFAEVALDQVRPLTLVLARVGVAAAALWLAVYASGQRMPRSVELWGAFVVMGALNNLIPVQPDLLGPDADHGRPRGDSERDHAAVHRRPRALPHPRREADTEPARRRPARHRRRDRPDRTRGPP
jgi:hypothetical protein